MRGSKQANATQIFLACNTIFHWKQENSSTYKYLEGMWEQKQNKSKFE